MSFSTINRRILLISLLASLGALFRAEASAQIKDVNSFLKNNVRTDVGGEGLWLPQLDDRLTKWLPARPGFAGQVYYIHATALAGLFEYEFEDERGQALSAQAVAHQWTPAYSRTRYRLGEKAEIEEIKFINDLEEAFSMVEVVNTSGEPQTLAIRIKDMLGGEGASFPASAPPDVIARRLAFKPTTYYFTELEIKKYYLVEADGFVRAGEAALTRKVELGPKATARFTARLALGNDPGECVSKLAVARSHNAFRVRVDQFNRWFAANVPEFTCSDKSYEKMYYYRWYVVKKSAIDARRFVPNHPYPAPVMYEGVAGRWFTKVIGLPLPLQILEARWLNDKSLAAGQARTALTRPDFFDYLNWTPWAIWQLHLVSPDAGLIREALPAMRRFVASEEAKDEDRDSLPTVWGSWITGMEYQPSFFYFTRPRWNHKLSDEFITNDHLTKDPAVYRKYLSLERVDEAVYYYLNNLATAKAAALEGASAAARDYERQAERVRRSVIEKMWDARTAFFYDIHPQTDEKAIEAKMIDGFFPFMFGALARASELSVFDHLLNPQEFWTQWPVPTASRDCPAFDSGGRWKVGPNASAARPFHYVDSWNGPTWIFSNALVADALGSAARESREKRLIDAFNQLMKKYTEIQFLKGDHELPCTVEHYDSITGENIRLLADYFHSCYNDLVIRYLAGVVPREDDSIEVDPLANGWGHFSISGVRYRNHKISVKLDKRFTVIVDGKTVMDSPTVKRFVYDPKRS